MDTMEDYLVNMVEIYYHSQDCEVACDYEGKEGCDEVATYEVDVCNVRELNEGIVRTFYLCSPCTVRCKEKLTNVK
jgi:hypothetical protein